MKETSSWSWHMLAGLFLVVFLGIHMITTHLDKILGWFNSNTALAGTDWVNVASRGSHLGMAFFYVVFLGIALYHGLYGLRTILFELNLSVQMEKIITAVTVIAGICLFAIGAVTAFYFNSVATI